MHETHAIEGSEEGWIIENDQKIVEISSLKFLHHNYEILRLFYRSFEVGDETWKTREHDPHQGCHRMKAYSTFLGKIKHKALRHDTNVFSKALCNCPLDLHLHQCMLF